ncbi:MAG: UDP-N-acetylmuramoyl-tripeptide--D-alanyl-D-alanine ligase [Pseudomonadota bacterium]|nr:UDP-N-acetylmuramoyl-tripeptide--D-alanyl-D-alanine ligase [Pseudomonadota bacterium]
MNPTVLLVLHVALLLVGAGAFIARRLIHLMRYFQQEEYDSVRFWAWCRDNGAFDRRGTVVALPTALALGAAHAWPSVTVGAATGAMVGLLAMARGEVDPRVTGKKKLVMTQRATRIYRLALSLGAAFTVPFVIVLLVAGGLFGPALAWLWLVVIFQITPLFLMLAERLLAPGEQRIQDGFQAEARKILADVHPTVIGITGSYGKTSTKMILGELLSADAPTFWTAKSINTPMGVTREIREKMKAHHTWAVMEMGAYNIGSVKRLCDFTPPKAAIVTAVGIMHLERFGSPENVYKAKSELAQAVPADGILVCNGDDPGARRMSVEFAKKTTLLYGFGEGPGDGDDLATRMTHVETTPEGSRFTLHWQGKAYPGTTPLHGRPMLSNLMAAFTMAAAQGVHPDVLLAVIRTLRPVENRLQVQQMGAVTWLHDAYNSNPAGFDAALDVLATMPGTRRILVTPGMVELGDQQEARNREVAAKAAKVCDLVLLVGETNRLALATGLREGGAKDDAVRWYARRDEAFAALQKEQAPGDVVLVENDLPDLYEGTVIL